MKKKLDLSTTFKTQVVSGELDLTNRSKFFIFIYVHIDLSDMHANELVKCIKMHSGPIKSLNLSKNRISDDGLVHIAKALCESSIESVNLSGNKISEKSIDSVVGSLKTHKALKVLDLQNNAITSRVVKNKLKNALPQIDVLI